MAAWTESRASHFFYDQGLGGKAVKVLPGEYYVDAEGLALVTVLGSCVSACIRDPELGVGGMNHFMLPDGGEDTDGKPARYGLYAMEMLVNELFKRGARRERLEAKVFGGGNVLPSIVANPVGIRNAAFVREFLATEAIAIVGADLLGSEPRKVAYFPKSGRGLVKRLGAATDVNLERDERAYRQRLANTAIGGELELF